MAQSIINIKLKNKDFYVIGDISLIANNLEFLGFAMVQDDVTDKKIVFTTDDLIRMEEIEVFANPELMKGE